MPPVITPRHAYDTLRHIAISRDVGYITPANIVTLAIAFEPLRYYYAMRHYAFAIRH